MLKLNLSDYTVLMLSLDARIHELRRLKESARCSGRDDIAAYCEAEETKTLTLLVRIKKAEILEGGDNV